MKRALRRHHKRRMKVKAQRIYGRYFNTPSHEKLADHLAYCSGPCCGNPRRWFDEPTMQERRFQCAKA